MLMAGCERLYRIIIVGLRDKLTIYILGVAPF